MFQEPSITLDYFFLSLIDTIAPIIAVFFCIKYFKLIMTE
ncbi:hypothetical protein FM106_22970 [Brachybacterium faecium]|nr:hypothetical protein FM106_22970 [Brachybacterium faecium]